MNQSANFDPSNLLLAGNTSEWHWLIDNSEIAPGKSAVLGKNEILFYTIHLCGIVIIFGSVISCTLVILSVCADSRKVTNKKWDFSDRFPIYLAISDGLWGLSNLSADHVVLMIRQVFPEKKVATALAMNVSFFFGYQQMMSAGLSLYTYLKIVRHVPLDLGRLEWKLHIFVVTFVASNICLYWSLDAYGNAGFWFLTDIQTNWGKVLGANICIFCATHAMMTLFAYRSIQNFITNTKRAVSQHIQPNFLVLSSPENSSENQTSKVKKNTGLTKQRKGYHSTANNCLTTFVYISICLYLPLAVFAWFFLIFGYLGYLEPISCLGIVVGANAGGMVNAWGYFHNKNIKNNRKQAIQNMRASAICSISSSSNV